MTDELRYTVREYQPGDEEAILETFNRVFAQIEGETYVPRTLEEWRWQFAENPAGIRIFLAVKDDDGAVLSQFASMPHEALLDDIPTVFTHGVDSFTDPQYRRGLKKPGLFLRTAEPYVQHYCGPPPDRDAMMWGLPVWQAWRIGKEVLKEEVLRTQLKLLGTADHLRFSAAPGVEVEEVDTFPEETDTFFEAARQPFGAIGLRSKRRLDWRFTSRPGMRYHTAVARRGGEMVGYAVTRAGHYDGQDLELLCDWMRLPEDEGAGHALRRWAWDKALGDEQDALVAVLPDTCFDWLAFQREGFRVRPTKYFPIARTWIKKYTLRWLFERWYYTLEETDLC